jgi:ubiquinone/menaquinone biosynthesis C-methylase UbiE
VDCQYIGLDRTEKMLAHAKNLYKDEIVLKQGYIQSIPFEDSSIDVVIARHILEHLGEGYEQAIREVFRVAREEVILVFFVDLAEGDEDVIKESEPDENGCTYFWNTYSNSKLMEFLSEFNCQIKVEYIHTPGAAANDTIVRLIK